MKPGANVFGLAIAFAILSGLLWLGFDPRVFAVVAPLFTYGPESRVPTESGVGAEPVPAGLWRQLAYPFRRPQPADALAADRG